MDGSFEEWPRWPRTYLNRWVGAESTGIHVHHRRVFKFYLPIEGNHIDSFSEVLIWEVSDCECKSFLVSSTVRSDSSYLDMIQKWVRVCLRNMEEEQAGSWWCTCQIYTVPLQKKDESSVEARSHLLPTPARKGEKVSMPHTKSQATVSFPCLSPHPWKQHLSGHIQVGNFFSAHFCLSKGQPCGQPL